MMGQGEEKKKKKPKSIIPEAKAEFKKIKCQMKQMLRRS